MQLEVGIVVPGVQFTDPSMTTTEGDAAEAKIERSRLRVEFRVDSTSGGGGEEEEQEAAAVLGPTVTVTRERQYRDTFDDGLLYKGEAQCRELLLQARATRRLEAWVVSSVHLCLRQRFEFCSFGKVAFSPPVWPRNVCCCRRRRARLSETAPPAAVQVLRRVGGSPDSRRLGRPLGCVRRALAGTIDAGGETTSAFAALSVVHRLFHAFYICVNG